MGVSTLRAALIFAAFAIIACGSGDNGDNGDNGENGESGESGGTSTGSPLGDTIPPMIAITSPSDSGTFTATSNNITVSGTASDNVGVDRVTWQLDGGAASDAVGTESWSTTAVMLSSGANTLTVTATDVSGNEATAEILVTLGAGVPGVLDGIAIIGDSNSDEYRADDDRGGAYAATTLNWMEQLVMNRGLSFGAWGTRESPRRTGYGFNWARSGATASSMLSEGQHTGAAQQVAAGEVTLVFIYIGANDFLRQRYVDIYDGTISGSALDNKIVGVISDITTAVDTVLAAGPAEVVVVDLFDWSLPLPALVFAYPDATRRQVVTDAVRSVNAGLATMAQQRGVVLVDITAVATESFAAIDANGFIDVGGELIDTVNPGDEPHHMILDDASGHAGTVSNGITANLLFINPINSAFGTTIAPFTDQEILDAAGITP